MSSDVSLSSTRRSTISSRTPRFCCDILIDAPSRLLFSEFLELFYSRMDPPGYEDVAASNMLSFLRVYDPVFLTMDSDYVDAHFRSQVKLSNLFSHEQ